MRTRVVVREDAGRWPVRLAAVAFCGLFLGVWVAGAQGPGGRAGESLRLGPEVSRHGTTFRVWAPNARSVAVMGDFNQWNASRSRMSKVDERHGIWEVTVRQARPGHAYRFLINGELERRDPYGLLVTADERSSVLYDHAAYDWRGDQPLTDMELREMVIYELHVGAFHDPRPRDGNPGTFHDAIRRIPYLQELGINVVCLLPVHEFSGRHSWGYNPSDLFAVETAYGGPDGLKDFVRVCHEHGIAVHLDIVHNHYGPQNLDLIQFDGTGARDSGGPYFYDGPGPIAYTPWGPRVRFDSPMVQRFIRDNVEMWMRDYHIDGFRWDSTVNIRAYDDGRVPIPAGERMLESINDMIRRQYPGRFSIAEDSLDIGNFHGSWDYDYHHQVMRVFTPRDDRDRDLNEIVRAVTRRPRHMWRVIYTDNHDEAGLLNREQRFVSDVDPQNPGSDYARRMSGLASLLVLTSPGIPLLFMGNEMMMSGPFHDDRPLNWGLRQRHAGHVRLHRDLIALRRNLEGAGEALQGLEVEFAHVDHANKTLVYQRWDSEMANDRMVVAINFSGRPQTLTVGFPRPGRWNLLVDTEWDTYDGERRAAMNQPLLVRGNMQVEVELAPYSGHVYGLAERPVRTAARRPSRTAVASRQDVAPRTAPRPIDEIVGELEAPVHVGEGYDEPPEEEWLSTYTTIALAGTFNDWSPTSHPLKLFGRNAWQAHVRLPARDELRLKLYAEKTEMIGWGCKTGEERTLPLDATLRWNGVELVLKNVEAGTYLIRFNDNSRAFSIEPAAEPAGASRSLDGFRTWTSRGGTTVRARVEDVHEGVVRLITEDGRDVRVRIVTLVDDDIEWLRNYVRAQRAGR